MDLLISNENVIQFVKYALAGGLATLVHIVVFHLTAWKLFPALQPQDHAVRFFKLKIRSINDYHRARNSMISNGVAFLISNLVAYVANVFWVFTPGRHSFIVEILLFYSVSALSTFLGTMLMGVLIKRLGMLTTYAFSSNILTAVLINYVVRKFFIFQG